MDTQEDGGVRPGYKLKLNSYDLGVDIELYDALQRIRFEHPEVRSVVLDERQGPHLLFRRQYLHAGPVQHAWKVNFCKFTNETRNGIEDVEPHSGLKFLAACNGTTAGGGYELALACDEIMLVDDRSSAVSLPEVPLLGVLPGTGGLTRADRQAQGAARPGGYLLHRHGRRTGSAREGLEARRRSSSSRSSSPRTCSGARSSCARSQSDRPADAEALC